jgi:hypothetical protein
MAGLAKLPGVKRTVIKPQVVEWTFADRRHWPRRRGHVDAHEHAELRCEPPPLSLRMVDAGLLARRLATASTTTPSWREGSEVRSALRGAWLSAERPFQCARASAWADGDGALAWAWPGSG